MLPTINNGVGVDFDTFESRSSHRFWYAINIKEIYIDCVTKFAAGKAFEFVKIDTNDIVDCWQQSGSVDTRKHMWGYVLE